jgi:O-antigen/teichoic acid export membrane protein
MVLMIVNTRLLVQLVEMRGLAAHAIIASFITWVALLNFGVPFSVQNLISRFRADGHQLDEIRQTASSITVLLGLAFLPVVLVTAFLVRRYLLADYPFVSFPALAFAFTCLFVGGLGTVYMSMLYAEHRGIWPNVYPAATTFLVFVMLLICKHYAVINFNWILALYFLPNAFFAVLAFNLLGLRLRVHLETALARTIIRDAKGFALIATLGALTLSVDYIILSRILPPTDVATYSLTSKIFLVIQAIHAVVLNSAWTPLSDLFFARKLRAARHRAIQLGALGVTLSVCWSAIVLVAAPHIYRLLAPNSVIQVSSGFLLLWVGYIVIRTWSDSFYIVLQSFGDTKALRRYMFFQAPISIGLQWLLGTRYGMQGILVGVSLSFVLTCAWYLPLRTMAMTRTA